MKRISSIFISVLTATATLKAQSASAVQATSKLVNLMKDSLCLSAEQRTLVYEINLRIAEDKDATGQKYPGGGSTARGLRILEPLRDTMYKRVLTAAQFQYYQKKRSALITN